MFSLEKQKAPANPPRPLVDRESPVLMIETIGIKEANVNNDLFPDISSYLKMRAKNEG